MVRAMCYVAPFSGGFRERKVLRTQSDEAAAETHRVYLGENLVAYKKSPKPGRLVVLFEQ